MPRRLPDGSKQRVLAIALLLFVATAVVALEVVRGRAGGEERGPWKAVVLPTAVPKIVAADGEVRGAAQLLARARSAKSDGKTFFVRSGDYGTLDLHGIGHRRAVTFRGYPGERAVFDEALMGDTRGIRLQDLRFAGPIDIQPGENRRIELLGNDIGGYRGVGVNVREHSTDIRIEGNRFHDLTQSGGDYAAGYGVRTSSPTVGIARVAIVDNRFERLGNDAMELGGVAGLLVARNVVTDVRIEPGSDAHSDPLFLWAGSRRVLVRGNTFLHNSQPVYLRGGIERVVFENNLVAGSDNYCMQVGGAGLPGDGIRGLVIRNNTVWDCGFGGILFSAASEGWRLVNNVVQSINAGPPVSRFDAQAFNLVGSGHTKRELRGRPRFVDENDGDYRLAPGSPGIDAGTSAGTPRRDGVGQRRWDDPDVRNSGAGPSAFYDVGAYERVATGR